MPRPLEIPCESVDFPGGGPVANGTSQLATSWDELLWAAVTVGRPNRHYVFRHGQASEYEAIFRWSLIRMALEQAGVNARRLRRTSAAKSLDPSEKGAVNYFVGMTLCKLFAARLLRAPWVVHLDVFRPQLDPVLTGRSRPDLVGETNTHEWVSLESKGRVSPPSDDAKTKAKQQAERLVSVGGVAPTWHIGAITFFRSDILQFYWRDPPPAESSPAKFSVPQSDDAWRYYYAPVFELVSGALESQRAAIADLPMSVTGLDIEVAIEPLTYKLLNAGRWGDAKRSCQERLNELTSAGFQPDGIRIVAGATWKKPFEEPESERGKP